VDSIKTETGFYVSEFRAQENDPVSRLIIETIDKFNEKTSVVPPNSRGLSVAIIARPFGNSGGHLSHRGIDKGTGVSVSVDDAAFTVVVNSDFVTGRPDVRRSKSRPEARIAVEILRYYVKNFARLQECKLHPAGQPYSHLKSM